MKTAQEMYKYCIDNDFGQGQTKKWGIRHFGLIENALQSDEVVHMAFIGLHNFVSISKHDSNFAYVVTNKRIIFAQHRMLGDVVKSVVLDNINDITMSRGVAFGVLCIDTIKEKFNVAVNKNQIQGLSDKLHEVVFDLKSVGQTIDNSSADEILKYKQLLDSGIITEEEFKLKKKQLLGI
mgnify:CR=1 FL=1